MKKALHKIRSRSLWWIDTTVYDRPVYEGQNFEMTGDCSELRGDCEGVIGDGTGLRGDFDKCNLTDKDRKKGININDLVGR